MELKKINEIAKKANIPDEFIEPYGFYKGKISPSINETIKDNKNGKLILVTAITPTRAGEGKTTTSIGLAEGFGYIGQDAIVCLREPALGPVFGIKGGATGGGKASIGPSEDINLHFNGDMHALTASINLISAIIDNHIFQGNELNIDPNNIVWNRVLDVNDRALRKARVAIDSNNPEGRPEEFMLTVASELMAILCIANDENDFYERMSKIIVAYTYDNEPITVKDLKVTHAVMKLMKDALKPNIVQTIEGNPVFIHGGPFANIAHGCNSLMATKLALKLSPIVITEAGFAADLGAEKFFDIVCRVGDLKPDAVVMVATIRALKMHGGQPYESLENEDVDALIKGFDNLKVHIENVKKFGVPVVVGINHFPTDTDNEIKALEKWCEEHNYEYSFVDSYIKGGKGAADLATKMLNVLETTSSNFKPIYDLSSPLIEKINTIAKEIYRAEKVEFTDEALEQLRHFEELGFKDAYICMAKTPASLSDDPKLLGAPSGFTLTVRECRLSAGANFVVCLTGKVLTMPGLPKVPSAVKMEDEPW